MLAYISYVVRVGSEETTCSKLEKNKPLRGATSIYIWYSMTGVCVDHTLANGIPTDCQYCELVIMVYSRKELE